MMKSIQSFRRDNSFYGRIDLILTVKSFDLQAIRARYIASKKNKSGRSGSVERRAVSLGGLVSCTLESGAMEVTQEFRGIPEPRGIAASKDLFAFSAEKEVYVLDKSGEVTQLSDPWFSYIHTIDISDDQKRVLISSSGFDLIQEWDWANDRLTREWLAWENGFNQAIHPETGAQIELSREPSENNNTYVVSDPTKQVLPTAMRAAFINSVTYQSNDEVLATFFHEGKVYKINLNSGEAKPVIGDMKNPHGGRQFIDGYLATSTGTGVLHKVVGEEEEKYSLRELPNKPVELGEMEWVQNALVHEEYIIAIDSNRTSFVIIDPVAECYDMIPYNNDWAVQDGVVSNLTNEQLAKIADLV